MNGRWGSAQYKLEMSSLRTRPLAPVPSIVLRSNPMLTRQAFCQSTLALLFGSDLMSVILLPMETGILSSRTGSRPAPYLFSTGAASGPKVQHELRWRWGYVPRFSSISAMSTPTTQRFRRQRRGSLPRRPAMGGSSALILSVMISTSATRPSPHGHPASLV